MTDLVRQRIDRLSAIGGTEILVGGRKGVEKESLRVMPDGTLALTPHPTGLGSALSNAFITTDFSEALLEFVTPAFGATWETLRSLCEIHQFTYNHLGDESLWGSSMPCLIGADEDIPLAQYGSSNVGTMKTVYRNGLGYRYGRKMQTIAGVHFNYSLPDNFWPVYREAEGVKSNVDEFRSEAYMGLVRNFRRKGWIALYLFGASPAVCKSFLDNGVAGLEDWDEHTAYAPYATSLRMSDLGYSNNTQAKLRISLNSLDKYITKLNAAICTPEPAYQDIGVKVGDTYRQLSANLLQIENEYYSPIRPKRVARSGERPTAALRRGGVEYVEVRSLDTNPFDPVGISQNTMRFLEAFLIYCMFDESPRLTETSWQEMLENHNAVAKEGRNPNLRLRRAGKEQDLKGWALEMLDGVAQVAALIDQGNSDEYQQAVARQRELVEDPDQTPAARVLESMRTESLGHFDYAMQVTESHKTYFNSLVSLDMARQDIYDAEARASVERQKEVEDADDMSFDEYLQRYYSEQGCCD